MKVRTLEDVHLLVSSTRRCKQVVEIPKLRYRTQNYSLDRGKLNYSLDHGIERIYTVFCIDFRM